MKKIKIIECPRDAMQGWEHFIPTEKKINYINKLLQVGFDTIDFGSFVSPKAIPQMADTKDVLAKLDMSNSVSKLLAIIANERGAEEAAAFEQISYLGFPFSISETFQQKNTNSSITESVKRVEAIQEICVKNNKELVVYISMGFGNPYGDEYSEKIAFHWVNELQKLGVKIFSLSDTVGVSNPEIISSIFSSLTSSFPALEFGAHFHSTPNTRKEKLKAAFDNNCLRFDSAIMGIGGCPMAQNELVGNMATETLFDFLGDEKLDFQLNKTAFFDAVILAGEMFL